MFKRFLFLAFMLVSGTKIGATTLTGTVTAPNGTVYAISPVIATFVNSPAGPPVVTPGQVTGTTNISGTFSITVTDNNTVVPTGSKWSIQVCYNGATPCAVVVLVVTGSSQDISSQLSAVAQNPGSPANGFVQVVLPFSATPVFNYANSSQETTFIMQLTGNVGSSTIAGVFVAGSDAQFILCQDGVGSHTFAWPSSFLNTPTFASVANQCTAATFVYCGTVGSGACSANSWQNTDQGPAGVGIPAPYNEINAASPPYNIVGDGGITGIAAGSSGSPIITCTDCHFQSTVKPAKVGMAVRMFSCVGCSNGVQVLANGTTILSVDSDSQIHASSNANGSITAGANNSLYWGTDWTVQATAAFTAEHAIPRCGRITFPAGYILLQNSAYGAQGATCNLGSNVDGSGEDIGCQGKDATFFIILPDSGNTTFISNNGTNGPVHLHDCHFYGGGWSAYNAHLINLGQDSTLMNIKFSSIGAANNNQGTLFMGSGSSGWASCINCYFEYTGGPEFTGLNITLINNFWNTQLRIDGAGTEVNDYGSVPGQNQTGFNGLIDNSHGAGIYRCYGVTASGGNNIVTLRVGAGSINYLNGCAIGNNTGASYGIFFDSGGATVYSQNHTTIAGGTNGALNNVSNNANSVFVDDGTTIFNGSVTNFTGQANSVYQYQSNTAGNAVVTAAKLVLSAGWGATAANTVLSGFNAPIGFTITNTGAGQAASPTITYTFPTPYAVSPLSCTATQNGGTNPSLNPFASSALSATGVTFTATGTPTVSDTEIMQVTCVLP